MRRIAFLMLLSIFLVDRVRAQTQVYLSDLTPVSVRQQWGALGIDRSVTSPQLTLGGQVYPKGLGTHAYSRIVYDLEGLDYQIFSAVIGIDDDSQGNGSVVFHVWLDSVEVLDSGLMLGSDPPLEFRVPLRGAKQLILEVTDGGDGIDCDHADWADAKLVKGAPLEGMDFTPSPQQKIWRTRTTSKYLVDFIFTNWDSPITGATIEVDQPGQIPFTIPVGDIPYGWRRRTDIKIPEKFVGDTTRFVLSWDGHQLSKRVFLPPATWIRAEGQFIALEVRLENYNVLNNPFDWITKLDSSYLAYEELVGGRPYGGKMITILEVSQYPGGWAVAGNPIKWHSPWIAPAFRQVNQGDWLFGILHELGHDFDLDYKWVWHGEFFANFKMVYVAERLKAKILQRGRWYDYTDPNGQTLDDYYRWQAEQTGEVDSLYDWFNHNDAATHKFLLVKNMIGWEPFKQTFRAYQALPWERVPSTAQGKLSLFVHYLEEYSGQELVTQFRRWGFPVIKIPSGVEVCRSSVIPQHFRLEQNYPNPFNPVTTIRYHLPVESKVRLRVFNPLGQRVLDLVDTVQSPGEYTVRFNALQLSSGVYFYQLEAIGINTKRRFSQLRKMLLLK